MSESLEKVRGVRFLPLFPLPLVLMPNELLPLHIFEPRYRQMLKDIRLEKNLFGLSYFDAGETSAARPEIGSYGCVAEVRETQTLDDGRSNVLTVGIARYRLEDYVEADEPYMVGEVAFFEDEAQDERVLQPVADEVLALFKRIGQAARDLKGESGKFPEVPVVTPQTLSFFVASAFNFSPAAKYEMLKTRSTLERLENLRKILQNTVSDIEEKARINKIARTNGHSSKKINL